jgi:hypothetical protein
LLVLQVLMSGTVTKATSSLDYYLLQESLCSLELLVVYVSMILHLMHVHNTVVALLEEERSNPEQAGQ